MASGYTYTVVIARSNHKHYTHIIPGKKNCIVLGVTLDPCPNGGFTGDRTPKKLTRFTINGLVEGKFFTGKPHVFDGKIYGFRLRISLKPIHWNKISWPCPL